MSHLKVRAIGGGLIHLLPEATMTALCGHTPQSNPRPYHGGHRKRRAGWYQATDQTTPATCKMCLTRLAMEQADER